MKIRMLAAIALIVIIFTGCAVNAGVDTMLIPPKLSEEQEQIYQALIKSVNSKISLKYPKSGANLSAFIVDDIDSDDEDEAIVFYELESIKAEGKSLRINILDKVDGEWSSVYDYSAEGVEVERVIISRLGEADRMNIIVGYTMVNPDEKQVIVYNYKDGVLKKNLSEAYSILDVRDLDNDGNNELLIVVNQTASKKARARVLKLSSECKYLESFVELNTNIVEFKQLIYGLVDNGVRGIYIDEVIGANALQTEIFTFENGLLRPRYGRISEMDMGKDLNVIRPASNKTMDIDGDSVLEIPINEVFSGYGDYPEPERLYKTNWFVFENNTLVKKYESYYSITKGYSFMFPSRWQGQVTAKIDSINDEVVICKYDGQLKENMKELMRIAVVEKGNIEDKSNEGYEVMKTKGEVGYLVWISPDTQEPLVPTKSEVMFNLMVIE
ncbi:MAG: hypothetical protein GX286_00235 [Clostridiales bacterium]|nr:hypothetical protein [Clostridiales bacterium]